jgi:hypothetical protein
MDIIYIILIVAGIGIMLVSLLAKQKEPGRFYSESPKQNSTDRAEMEKALQRISKRLEEEQKHLMQDAEHTRLELMQEIAALRKRVDELESFWNAKPDEAASLRQGQAAAVDELQEEPDMLALKERYRRVFELADEGLSPDEIAKRLGAGRGEIDLIFMLAAKRERGRGHA